jgi:hypothetical protein
MGYERVDLWVEKIYKERNKMQRKKKRKTELNKNWKQQQENKVETNK